LFLEWTHLYFESSVYSVFGFTSRSLCSIFSCF